MVTTSKSKSTVDNLQETLSHLPNIYTHAQSSIANHKKNVVAVRKIQERCAEVTQLDSTGKGVKLVGEKAFNNYFIEIVNKVLSIKKGVGVADKVVAFVGKFCTYTTDTDAAKIKSSVNVEAEDQDEEDDDSMSSRFIIKLLTHLLSGCESKDKNVRFRVVQMIVAMINGLGEIDEQAYISLRSSLLQRSNDKEPSVRVQAALGLAKLQSGEDPDELEEGEEGLEEVLLDLLRFDPAPEVRRAALYNLPLTPTTLPHILSRTRDIDPILRRTVYLGSLSTTSLPSPDLLNVDQRELVVKNGLGDREGGVRRATAGMLSGWLGSEEGDLVKFLKHFDVVGSPVAEDALLSLFADNRDIVTALNFEDEYWNEVTPEKAFLARVFVDHCKSTNDEALLESALPVVTLMVFKIQEEYNQLNVLSGELDEENDEPPQAYKDKTFIISELFKLAVNLDYADELGRRKMSQLAGEMISQVGLPGDLIPRALDILRKLSSSEKDLIRIIVDVVTELRSGPDLESEQQDAESQVDGDGRGRHATPPRFDVNDPQAVLQAAMVDLRCLAICTALLKHTNGNLQDNSAFHGLVTDLIIPSCQSKEPILREEGLVCLGLCCLIDAKLAKKSFSLFMSQLGPTNSVAAIRCKVAQVIFDLLMVHDASVLLNDPSTMPAMLVGALEIQVPEVQAIAAEGIAKLMLSGMVYNEHLFMQLIFAYLNPDMADNLALRQCLTYFFPVYCYSSPKNQRRLQKIFLPTFRDLADFIEQVEGTVIVPLSQMGLLLIDWSDPSKVVERDGLELDPTVHVDLAIDLVKEIMESEDKDLRKLLVSYLSKLHLPEEIDDKLVQTLVLLVRGVKQRRPLADATSRNSLIKFENTLKKKYSEQLETLDEDALREVEEMHDVFSFIDGIEEWEVKSEVRESRSREPSTGASTPVRAASSRIASKKARKSLAETISEIDEDSEEDEGEEGEDQEGGEDDEEESDAASVVPERPKARPARRSRAVTEEADSSASYGSEEDDDLE